MVCKPCYYYGRQEIEVFTYACVATGSPSSKCGIMEISKNSVSSNPKPKPTPTPTPIPTPAFVA